MHNTNKKSKEIIDFKEIEKRFLERIKEIETSEQKLLLKLYNEIINEMK